MIKNLSIIFPIYNEEKRLKKGFNYIENFILKNKNKNIQIIFVNDGSTDKSRVLLSEFKRKCFLKNYKTELKIVNLKKNVGKGAAISKGLVCATNRLVLTIDIDMSVPLKQIIIWENKFSKLNFNNNVFFGSRAHKLSEGKRQPFRQLLGYVMRKIIMVMLGIEIKDTQCGFKLYPTYVAKKVFKNLTRPRYEHDVEVVLRLKKQKINIFELPVHWSHKNFSKVNIFTDPIKMLIGIIFLRFKYI